MLINIVLRYNSTRYFFIKYVYDAYGNHKVYGNNGQENTEASFIGNINPFRYRGYYYDVETKLYYLNSRYYDPEVGRFLSPDILSILDETMMEANGLNLYMYGGNNPVMYEDPNGYFAWFILAAIMLFTPLGGIVAQVVISIVSYMVTVAWALGDLAFNNGQGAWKDMNSINWNPFNTDENSVLKSDYVSFYKGVPVFRFNGDRSGSFFAIFLKRTASIESLKHERGHNWQSMMMGIGTCLLTAAIPSILMLGPWSKNEHYYAAPWETLADILGGVDRKDQTEEDRLRAW